MREVAKVRDVDVGYALFSLKVVNEGRADPLADAHEKGVASLRTLALVRRSLGDAAMADVYGALAARVHERGEDMTEETLRRALGDAEFDPGLVDEALADGSTIAEVRDEHERAVATVGAFGVPTIVLESGNGIFGPVIAVAPEGEEAGRLWDHVVWLTERDDFFELKRERDRGPGERQARPRS